MRLRGNDLEYSKNSIYVLIRSESFLFVNDKDKRRRSTTIIEWVREDLSSSMKT